MIHIERNAVEPPRFFRSSRVHLLKEQAQAFFSEPANKRRQSRFDFAPLSREQDIREALLNLFHGKCAYCETPIESTDFSITDHFRPKSSLVDQNGKFHPDHYWWLAYEWSNLYLCCSTCNRRKGNRFPIRRKRAQPGDTGDKLLEEAPLLLDPCYDYPEEHLVFSKDGRVRSETPKGVDSIKIFDLNRTALVERRQETYTRVAASWDILESILATSSPSAAYTLLADMIDPARPFAAIRQQFMGQWLAKLPDTTKALIHPDWQQIEQNLNGRRGAVVPSNRAIKASFSIATEKLDSYSVTTNTWTDKKRYFSRMRTIERVEINNFRIHSNLTIEINTQDTGLTPWCMLLGENSSGKSSILQAIALALAGDEYRARLGITPEEVLRYRCRRGSVKVYFSGNQEPVELHFQRGSSQFESVNGEPKVLLLGYGATRLLPHGDMQSAEGARYARLDNLFNPHIPLKDATGWLLSLDTASFDRIALALKDLLQLEANDRLIRHRGKSPKIIVDAFGTRLPLLQLSDGYQSVVALTADIMSVMQRSWPTMDLAEGIVLIDELEAHLHPSWKMRIVSSLRQVFPRIQFLTSTHDPLCLRGLRTGEVVLLQRMDQGGVQAVTDLPSIEGLRVDQLLTSEYFGLNSTIDPEIERIFNTYYDLLAKRDRSAEEEQQLTDLKKDLDKFRQLGTTRRERLALEAADEYLAEETRTSDRERLQHLKSSTHDRIKELFQRTSASDEG